MLLLDPTKWSLAERNAFVFEANRVGSEAFERWGVDKYVGDVHDSYDVIEAMWPGVDRNGKGAHCFAVVKGVFLLDNPVFAGRSIRRLRYQAYDFDLAYKHWAMYGDGKSIRPEVSEYFGNLEDRKPDQFPVARHAARRKAWDLLCRTYEDLPAFGCPDKRSLLEHLPKARRHILTGGFLPWPLLDPDNVGEWEDASAVFVRLTEAHDVPENAPIEDRWTSWIFDECERLRQRRPFGTFTRQEAYETGVYAARRFHEDIGVAWPGDDDPEPWATRHEQAFFAYTPYPPVTSEA